MIVSNEDRKCKLIAHIVLSPGIFHVLESINQLFLQFLVMSICTKLLSPMAQYIIYKNDIFICVSFII